MGGFFSSYDGNVHVVVVGAGYAGIQAAKALDSRVHVTLIEATDSHNHKIASLRAAVVPGWEKRIRLPLDGVLKNGKLVQAEVTSVDTGKVTLSDRSVIDCDYVILAHGKGDLNFPSDYSDDVTTTVGFEAKARQMQQIIAKAKSVLLVGGGAVGVELAGEIASHHPGKPVTLVHSRAALLSHNAQPLIPAATDSMLHKLTEIGVNVVMSTRVTNTPKLRGGDGMLYTPQATQYVLSNGANVSAELYIDCTGTTRRVNNLVPPAQLDAHNLVKVDSDLQVQGIPRVFCIGDANNLNETKLAFFAQQHARTVVTNILNLQHHRAAAHYVVLDYAIMAVPIGPFKGTAVVGSRQLGDTFVSWVLGRGLFVQKVWGGMGLRVPALGVEIQSSDEEKSEL